jgi:hypothetical protein
MASLPGVSASFPEVVDWATGETRSGTVVASMQLSIGEMYGRMAAAQGAIGQGLLLVLLAIGVLFLIIEAIALVAGLALARSITGRCTNSSRAPSGSAWRLHAQDRHSRARSARRSWRSRSTR